MSDSGCTCCNRKVQIWKKAGRYQKKQINWCPSCWACYQEFMALNQIAMYQAQIKDPLRQHYAWWIGKDCSCDFNKAPKDTEELWDDLLKKAGYDKRYNWEEE